MMMSKYIPEIRTRGNDQNDRTCSHFLAALIFAQRALCAAAILLRPAAEMVLFFRLDFLPRR